MSDWCFITDLHLTNTSRVRSGDVVEDLCKKLQFVVDYCHYNDCGLLIGGDIFDKPTVPDVAKNRFIEILRHLDTPCYSVAGNHSELWNNPEYNYKTSYNTLIAAGLTKDLDLVDGIDCPDVFITSKVPVIDRGKPQIVIKHGFLNIDDGRWTFRFTDLEVKSDPVVVLLGHDHVEYEDLRYTEQIKIIRPGSFLRGIRNDANERQPKLVHVRVQDGRILTKKVVIDTARDWSEIFKTKEVKISKAQQHATYDEIIESIRNSKKTDITFRQAMQQVAEPTVVEFAMQVLEEANMEINNKKL